MHTRKCNPVVNKLTHLRMRQGVLSYGNLVDAKVPRVSLTLILRGK